MSVTLPDGLASADHSIASMDVGASGWTVPWAMYHDKSRCLWLNGSYTIHAHPGGTVQMWVRRDDDGWHVDAAHCDAESKQWNEAGYVGNFTPILVASFRA